MRAPAVLGKCGAVSIPEMEDAAGRLHVITWYSEQEIRKIAPRFRPRKCECPVKGRVGIEFHFAELELTTDLYGMCSVHFGDAVAEIESRVDLIDTRNCDAHGESIEDDVLNALKRGRLHDDARRSGSRHEALEREADPAPAVRESDIVGVAHEADVELVDPATGRHRADAKRNELRAAQGQRVKPGNAGSALLCRVRIVEPVVIKKVVTGE